VINGDQIPRPCLVHQAKRRDDAGRRITARPLVAEPYPSAPAQRSGEVAQLGYPITAAEPAGHIQMNQRGARSRAAESGGGADLAVRRGDGAVKTEVAQHIRDAQDKERLCLVGVQGAQREPVVVHELAPAAWPGLGNDRDAHRAERLQIPVDGPDRHLKLTGQSPGGHPAAGLQDQDQRHQTICSHQRTVTQGR
jgi:hypothetical protein